MKNIIWIVAVFLVAVGLIFLFKDHSIKFDPSLQAGVVHPLDHVKGNASSTVVLVEYADFQCPACRSYYPLVREMTQAFGDKIAVVFRHFPINTIHPNAEFAARAAEAAGKQGKFWEMHDLLFEKQAEWETVSDVTSKFTEYAKLLGISEAQFATDFTSKEVKDFVRGQANSGVSFGVQGTPTFFLNGEKINNPTSSQEFKTVINKALGNI